MNQIALFGVLIVFGILAAAVQIYIFYLESFAWRTPAAMKLFKTSSLLEAETTRVLAFNQGWYNLFLAILDILGMALLASWPAVGFTLLLCGTVSAFLAALVLFCTNRKLRSAAVKQGILPLVEIILIIVSLGLTFTA